MKEFLASLAGLIPVSIIVSLATTIWFRAVDQKRVDWLVNGYSWPRRVNRTAGETCEPADTGDDAVALRVSNTGNGTAYAVKVRTNPGGDFKTMERFAGPAIGSGEHVELELPSIVRGDDTAYVEIEWTAPRVLRGPHTDTCRISRADWYTQNLDSAPGRERLEKWFPLTFLDN